MVRKREGKEENPETIPKADDEGKKRENTRK